MDTFQQPAFSITMPTNDFDPDRVPIDGEQYLQSVVYERNKCPAVVVKPFERDVNESTQQNEQQTSQCIWNKYAEVSFEKIVFQMLC